MTDHSQSKHIRVSLIPGISLAEDAGGELALVSEYGRFPLRGGGAGAAKAFRALADGGHTEAELAKIALAEDGIGGLTRFNHLYAQCVLRCFVRYGVYADGTPLLSLTLTVPLRRFDVAESDAGARLVLSRFAYCHREGDALVLETPLFGAKAVLHDAGVAGLLAALAVPSTTAELAAKVPALPPECVADILRLLRTARALTTHSDEGTTEEDDNVTLRLWEFHDLLFHSRSRIGRHNNPVGATFRHLGLLPPPPLVKEPRGEAVTLPVPEAGAGEERLSLFDAIETRRSIRAHGEEPISLEQLGWFLYRVARIRARWDYEIRNPEGVVIETLELSSRPYPAGGAIYELELYLTVDRCRGLDPGLLYRYNALEHRLHRIPAAAEKVAALLRDASQSAGIGHRPQVLITLASRFQRLTWKYNTMAYAATLKNVGVLYQSMYLVATAMKLAPCALGSGNSDLFAEAAGTDYYAETSVGEFMLGSLPASEEPPAWAQDRQFVPNDLIPPRAK